MELAVLATGVNTGRERGEERLVEHAAGNPARASASARSTSRSYLSFGHGQGMRTLWHCNPSASA
jgi:hypothetical protein